MDAFRKQLDQLMGTNRNGDVPEVEKKYYDRDVCRLFLCGLCPHDLFQLTKMDLGPCAKVHSLQLRKEYEEGKSKGRDNYDRELEDVLEKHVMECDRKIARSLKRLEDDGVDNATAIAVSKVTTSPEVDEISKQIHEQLKKADDLELEGKTDDKIRTLEAVEALRQKKADAQALLLMEAFNKDRMLTPATAAGGPPGGGPSPPAPDPQTQKLITEKLQLAEKLGEEGKVDEAKKIMEEAEKLRKVMPARHADVILYLQGTNVQLTDQKLRVCDICGAFLSIYDSDRRLADHFGGKLHIGYVFIREKLRQLKEERLSRRTSVSRSQGPDGVTARSREEGQEERKIREGEKERERSHERDRERSRDKDRERDRKDRDGDRERDRNRDRDKDKGRDKDKDKDRDRVRDGDRDKVRDRDRDNDRDRRDRDRERRRESDHERSSSRSHQDPGRTRDFGDNHADKRDGGRGRSRQQQQRY
eukprot:TRINITY_DN5084_c0_g1_i1.p1 TRINITY_DN5084_c0_g1~~TRINITY_DN5084_c0_g1_i1.p1  ORF type:complete len:474 (+),score=122.60 TRINITY_DN5084_c0_g1_i1:148-1569(+)